jgi:hypothetical protein
MDDIIYFSRNGKYRSLSHIWKSKISKQFSINKDNEYILSLQYHGKKHSVIDFYLTRKDLSDIFIHGISKAHATEKDQHFTVHNIVPRDMRVYYKVLDELSDNFIYKLFRKRQLDIRLNIHIHSKTYKYKKKLHSRVVLEMYLSYRGLFLRYSPYNIQPYEIVLTDEEITDIFNNVRKIL